MCKNSVLILDKCHLFLRPQAAGDTAFLLQLYGQCREDELSLAAMTPPLLKAFVTQQYTAREADYHRRFHDAAFMIVCKKKKKIGRIAYTVGETLHVIDIAVLKKERSNGYGGAVMEALCTLAASLSIPVSLNVEIHNRRAIRFYEALKFKIVQNSGMHYRMQRRQLN